MGALAGYKASVYVTTSPSLSFTNEATTDAGDHKTYTITNSAKRYWDPTQAITVQTSPDGSTGWTTVTTGFTIQRVGGVIHFTSAVTGSTPSCRVSGSYMPYSTLAGSNSIEVQVNQMMLDSTTFASGGWMEYIGGEVSATFKLARFWIDAFFLNSITNRMVISCYTGANANQRIEAFAFLKTDATKIDVKKTIDETIDFDSDGQVYSILT